VGLTRGDDFADRLAALTSRIGRHWGLQVELAGLPGGAVEERLGRNVRSIVQEALVNASRHGRASRARVEIRRIENGLRVSIEDDGRGFPFHGTYDLAALTASKLGPVSLKRRIAALGGRLVITSTAAGANVDVTLPFVSGGC
jgi:signal transduction histidine kinase